jgi:DNA topoisomerase-1
MAKTLVIVESPAKAKTIKKYLGAGYEVVASKGHVKDLPKKMGIDVANGFEETYEVIETKAKVLAELKAESKKADVLLLATDPDREGEAIAFHIAEELARPKLEVRRVEFEEITKKGVQRGIDSPRDLDANLYSAQRCRRVLDRIVGYDVSALVWSKLAFGLSAGRVQSVALRLIVEREREIEAFVPDEYWNVGAVLRGKAKQSFHSRLVKADGEKLEVTNGEQAAAEKRNAPAPYTTSKLQQDATSHLRFPTKRTMNIAQRLYEGIDLKKDGGLVGLITYMRTDSVRISPDAILELREYIKTTFGEKHLPAKENVFKSRKDAQEAHEAIRPTSLEYTPESVQKHLSDEQYKLYKLIWDRFVASQMSQAVYDQTGVDIEAVPTRANPAHKSLMLRSSGKVLKFSGWLEQYQAEKGAEEAPKEFAGEDDARAEAAQNGAAERAAAADDEEGLLPELSEGEALDLVEPPGVLAEQKFTQPPPRFNEGSLVRELEKRGIGRPSTYAEIISKVQARDYVEKLPGGQMKASDLGKRVTDGLVSTHLDFMEPSFTAKMEEDLDEVQAGRLDRVKLLDRFYGSFRQVLDSAKKDKRWAPEPEPTEYKCDDCGAPLLKRWGKNGFFLSCETYPKCKFTRDLSKENGEPAVDRMTDYICDKCEKPMVIKTGRYGEFLSCSGYPECKNAKPVPLGMPCPKCEGDIIEIRSKKKGSRPFYGCANYPKCDFKVWQKPVNEPCPQCSYPFLVIGGGAKNPKLMCGKGPKECDYSRPIDEPGPAELEAAEAAEKLPDPEAPKGKRRAAAAAVAP